jgi:serine/threonine protein kinase
MRHEMHLLERELDVSKRISHNNIVQFYDTYEDPEYFYISMEY